MFKVAATQCATCIYRPDSPLDLAKLEAEIADPRMAGFFHRATEFVIASAISRLAHAVGGFSTATPKNSRGDN